MVNTPFTAISSAHFLFPILIILCYLMLDLSLFMLFFLLKGYSLFPALHLQNFKGYTGEAKYHASQRHTFSTFLSPQAIISLLD